MVLDKLKRLRRGMVLEFFYESGYKEYLKLVRIEKVAIPTDSRTYPIPGTHSAPAKRVKMWRVYPRHSDGWYENSIIHFSGRYLKEHCRELSPLEKLVLFGEV